MNAVVKHSMFKKLAAITGMLRPLVALQAMAYVVLGAYLGGPVTALFSRPVASAALVVGLIVACGYVMNDAHDVSVDSLSRPERAIPAGRVALREAHVVTLALAAAAVTLALTLGAGLAIFALATVLLSAAYSYILKDTVLLGNLTIALLDGGIIVFGSLAAGALPATTQIVFVLIFLYIAAQEILYTLDDLKGDAQEGIRTIATQWGVGPALWVFRLVLLAFVMVAILPSIAHLAPARFLYAILICTVAPTLAIAAGVSLAPGPRAFHLAPRLMKLVWLLSLVPVLLLK